MSQDKVFQSQEPFQEITQDYVISFYDQEIQHSLKKDSHYPRHRIFPESPNYKRLITFEGLQESELNLLAEIVETINYQVQVGDHNNSQATPFCIPTQINKNRDILPTLLSKLKSREKESQLLPQIKMKKTCSIEEPEKMSCILELQDWKARFQAQNQEVVKLKSLLEDREQQIKALNSKLKNYSIIHGPIGQKKQPQTTAIQGCTEETELLWQKEKKQLFQQHESILMKVNTEKEQAQAKVAELKAHILSLQANHQQQIAEISNLLRQSQDKGIRCQIEISKLQLDNIDKESKFNQTIELLQQQMDQQKRKDQEDKNTLQNRVSQLQQLVEKANFELEQRKMADLENEQQHLGVLRGLCEKIADFQKEVQAWTQKQQGYNLQIQELRLEVRSKCLKLEEQEMVGREVSLVKLQLEQAKTNIQRLLIQNETLAIAKDKLESELRIYEQSIQDTSFSEEHKERQLENIKNNYQTFIKQTKDDNLNLKDQIQRKNGVINLLIEQKESLMIQLQRVRIHSGQSAESTSLNLISEMEMKNGQLSQQMRRKVKKIEKLEQEVTSLNKQIEEIKKAAKLEISEVKKILQQKSRQLQEAYQAHPEISQISKLTNSISRVQTEKLKETKQIYLQEFFQKLNNYKNTLTQQQTLQLRNKIGFILS